ncbi:MAG: hypothetical protein ABW140_14135 [Candidatus Sedimenticola sp. 6PFRAG1]
MTQFDKPSIHRHGLLAVVAISILSGCMTSPQKPAAPDPAVQATPEPVAETVSEPATDLMGEWCYVKKRRVTKYTVKEGKLLIRTGRSGQYYEADLTCNDAYTLCEGKTMRGWQTPVTETLRLDDGKMNLTRVWGGSWKDKTYSFTYTRCPKW